MQPEPRHDPALSVHSQPRDVSRAVAWYGVAVLSVVQLFSFMDRQALSLLIGPIKAQFGMSDVQVSLVIGLGFAIAYAIAGLPIGRLVDQWFRPALLGLGLTVWSICTAACGFAGSFTHLALLRSGVGIGEATLTPTVISFLGDYFPPSKRGISFGVFAVSVYVGSGLSLVAGGAILKAFRGCRIRDDPDRGRGQAVAVGFPADRPAGPPCRAAGVDPVRASPAASATRRRPRPCAVSRWPKSGRTTAATGPRS